MNLSLEHIGLASLSPAALKDWYVKALDAKEVFDNRQIPPAFFIELPGGALIEIYPASHGLGETGHNRLQGFRHLALRVDSIEVAKAHLGGRGVSFSEPIKPAGGGGRVLFFRDPDGNLLHLVERPAGWSLPV